MRFSARTYKNLWGNRKFLILILHQSGIIEKDPIFPHPVSTWHSRDDSPNQEHRACWPTASSGSASIRRGHGGRHSHSLASRLRRLSSLQTDPGGVHLKLFQHSNPGCRRLGLALRIVGRGCPSNCRGLCRAPVPGRQSAESVGTPRLIPGAGVGRIATLLLHCFPAFFRYTDLVRRSVNMWNVVELKSDSELDRKLRRLNWALQADMPSPEPAERDSFEEFQKVWERSNLMQEGLDGGAGQEQTGGNEGMLVESARSANIVNSR